MTKREKLTIAAAALLAVVGAVFMTLRFMGMRFSGILLVCLAALLLLGLVLDRWAKKSRGGWYCRLAFRAGCALVLIPLMIFEIRVVHEGRQAAPEEPCQAVVVLGAGVNGTAPSLTLRTRLDAALTYLEAQPEVPVVLTGGKGYGEEITEAQCMYYWLTERGVDPERLILEEQATNTAENFAFSKALLEARGIDPASDTVAVVTSDFHIARSRVIAGRQGYAHTLGVPAELPWLHLEVNYYVREAFAMVKTLLLDWN